MSTAKRQQRAQAYTSHMATSALERQLLNAQLAKQDAEKKLRAKESEVEKLEADRRLLAGREAENEQAMEEERAKYAEEKAQVDAGRATTWWNEVHDGYRDAVLLRAAQAEAVASATQLGIANLGTTGVIP